MTVRWKCAHCGHSHKWRWESCWRGPIEMLCDVCNRVSCMALYRRLWWWEAV